MKKIIRLIKHGNSYAIKIPNSVIEQLSLNDGQSFNVHIKNESIVLTPVNPPKDIHELFQGWKDDEIRDTELNWGAAKGNELKW